MSATKTPAITILIVSHDKPHLLREAVASVMQQTMPDWQAVLVDSGSLYDQGCFARFRWADDPRLRVIRSSETPEVRRRKAMAPWCFNECFRRGRVHGELVMYLCDDDILYPNAFATFVEAFQKNPAAMAMYASQDIGWLEHNGHSKIIGERRALTAGGKCCHGRIMDCQVDYLQFCHRRSALDVFTDTEYWPEGIATGDHADGLFMEKLGSYYEILPIDVKVSQNRRTPWSVNLPATGKIADIARQTPVHESIMDAWTTLRHRLERNLEDIGLREAVAEFQAQLRLLCEQDHAQRARLVSRRYRVMDKVHALLSRAPSALRFLKSFAPFKDPADLT
jgi:spore maturation protein CgeD